MNNVAVADFVRQHKPKIDEEIEEELARRSVEASGISSHLASVLAGMKELSLGGKRLRGLLTILGYEIAGGKTEAAIYKAAAVMEIFHLGLLVQDDVMDRDNLRRGVKTIHSRYDDLHLGEAIAISAGDLTFGWGMETISSLTLPKERVNKAIGIWGKYFSRVGYGQILDVMGSVRGETDDQEVLQVLKLKSGEYTCVLPLLLGAALAGGDDKLMNRLANYGMELGWVFQLRDDWLSEYGDSEKTGKPVGNDRREGRKSYATMYGKAATELAIKEHWEKGKQYAGGNMLMEELLSWLATRDN